MAEWVGFKRSGINGDLDDINYFVLTVHGRFDMIWMVDDLAAEVGQRVYEGVAEVLTQSGLHKHDKLVFQVGQSSLVVEYEDERFGFVVELTRNGLYLRRRGSSARNFDMWYMTVARHFSLLVERVFESVSDVLTRRTGFRSAVSPTRAEFRFDFVLYDFRDLQKPESNDLKPLHNVHVLRDVLPRIPGEDGQLATMSEEDAQVTRVDVKVYRRQTKGDSEWIEVYDVQAPANRQSSSVWFYFSFIGEALDDVHGDGHRTSFDGSDFLNEWHTAYSEFLHDRAVGGFMSSIFAGYTFKTTAGQLP